MTNNHTLSLLITSLFLSLFFSPPLITSSPQQICNFTTYPDFCNSSLPHHNHSLTNFDYGRISIQQSLSHAQRFLLLIQHYLGDNGQQSNSSPRSSRSLEDCQYLATLNINFFSRSLETLTMNDDDKLDMHQVDDLHTLLSATLTNLQTCFDGLVEASDHESSSPRRLNDLTMSPYFAIGTKSYSVSLAIFKHTWVEHAKNNSHWEVMNRNALLARIGNWLETDEGDGCMISRSMVVVSKDGGGDFDTIRDALRSVSENKITSNSDSYHVMFIKQGIYAEYVTVPSNMTNLILVGAGINKTVITGNRSVGGNWTTFDSATFAVDGEGFVAINITFRNTAGAMNGQAVAVRDGGDRSTFYLCSFEGYQDTLYAESMRQFYRECDIYGTVDFIFGNAAVVFQNCSIYARQPLSGQGNMITAQGRADPNQNTGTCFHDCRIKAADDLISSNYDVETYLGRPWKEYSRTVYMLSFMDSLVNPAGWSKWGGEDDDDFALHTLYYAEYNNYGPGSKRSKRVMSWPGYHVINSTDAANFTVANFISGDTWLPPLVPYVAGL